MQRVKVEVEPTKSALATAMLNSKTTPQAASGCGIRHWNSCAQASSLRHQITWYRHSKEVSMVTLRAGTAPAATTWHCHTDKRRVEKILTIPYTYLNPRIVKVGGLGARICNDSQKLQRKWSAKISWKRSESMPRGVLQAPRGHPAGHVHKWGGDRWLHRLEINFA